MVNLGTVMFCVIAAGWMSDCTTSFPFYLTLLIMSFKIGMSFAGLESGRVLIYA